MEPAVLAELVEHEPEVPITSGPDLPAAAVEAYYYGLCWYCWGGRYCCCWYC